MRLLIQHKSSYRYPKPASLGPHLFRLKPTNHARARVESYSLNLSLTNATPADPARHETRWQQDPSGNNVARVTFAGQCVAFDVLVELAVDIKPVNPFDFFVDRRVEKAPFSYPQEIRSDIAPYLEVTEPLRGGPLHQGFLETLPREGNSVELVVALNRAVNQRIKYVVREELGVFTPEECLAAGFGSCRDSALLLVAALRSRGFAARFVSGYLIQLQDEGMIPDAPRGVSADVVDLHAWAETYLPGAGWIGLDATSGLFAGEGHIPLACTSVPAAAAPVDGTSDVVAEDVSFAMRIARLGHEPRPTRPYEEEVWQALVAAGERADARLASKGLTLTMGGEPTFNSRIHPEAPEWNGDALGPTKWAAGRDLAREIRSRVHPGAVTIVRQGKHYPGESMPRWSIDLIPSLTDAHAWPDREGLARSGHEVSAAKRFMDVVAAQIDLAPRVVPAYEDPWHFIAEEARLPLDVDAMRADLSDSEERRRLARVLGRGLGTPAGYVLPLTRTRSTFVSDAWRLRRSELFLLPGDGPLGLRLPLASLEAGDPVPGAFTDVVPDVPDLRVAAPEEGTTQKARKTGPSAFVSSNPPRVRSALAVEARAGELFVFLPPLRSTEDFFALVRVIDAARAATGFDVTLEGYPPPRGPGEAPRLSVAPDPGVLEVNLTPVSSMPPYLDQMERVFDAALHAGLHSEKYLVDGRMSGSGGGHHLTLGGPTPLESPFLERPDILASLVTFFQHHPALAYVFTGLFVGPTSQAPRVDEARHDALDELEIALSRAFEMKDARQTPWAVDMLFRNLLVDVAGNTHRTEISIDKLFAPGPAHGRQGLIELRAFEMPPHVRMAAAQMILVRSLVAAFAEAPYKKPLVRFGSALHDRFLLPYFASRDLGDVLDFLLARGFELPLAGYDPFVDLRCPLVGSLDAGDVHVELRNAIEPWPVLGEEATTSGTSRYVDSSLERIEVRASGLVPERHAILVNGRGLPMTPTSRSGQLVAGVRFRAWNPPHSLQPHLGIHHPIRLDVVDTWGRRSLGACAYHVWHPEGRAFDSPPLTRFEAAARRAQRFTPLAPLTSPVDYAPLVVNDGAPVSVDLRRHGIDHPVPAPFPPGDPGPFPAVIEGGRES